MKEIRQNSGGFLHVKPTAISSMHKEPSSNREWLLHGSSFISFSNRSRTLKSTAVKHAQTRQTGVTQIIKYHPISPVWLARIKHDAAVREREPGIRAVQVGVLETATPEGGWLGRGASVWSADSSPGMLTATLFTVRNKQPACLGGSHWLMELCDMKVCFCRWGLSLWRAVILHNSQGPTK